MSLFGTQKTQNAHKLYADRYYKNYHLGKPLCDGIELVAKIERKSKKDAAELLMKAGLSSYTGAKLTEYLKDERAAQEFHQRMRYNRFVHVLRQYAREQGMEISKFI
jgi:hypothetical protein